MASKSDRMYGNSPKLEKDKEGKVKVTKNEKVNDGVDKVKMTESHDGTAVPAHSRHSLERLQMHHKHQHEHLAHDHAHSGDKHEMHKRHEEEIKMMHKKHEKELAHDHSEEVGGKKIVEKVEENKKGKE